MTNGAEAASFGANPREVSRNINNKLRELLTKCPSGEFSTTDWYDPSKITFDNLLRNMLNFLIKFLGKLVKITFKSVKTLL